MMSLEQESRHCRNRSARSDDSADANSEAVTQAVAASEKKASTHAWTGEAGAQAGNRTPHGMRREANGTPGLP